MKKIFNKPVHILLLPIFPTLALLAHNFNELQLLEILFPIGVLLVVVLAIFFLVNTFIVKNRYKSAAVISAACLVFRPVYDLDFLLGIIPVNQFIVKHGINLLFFSLSILWLAIVLRFVTTKISFRTVTYVLNICAFSCLLMPVFLIIRGQIYRMLHPVNLSSTVHFRAMNVKDSTLPDIYYIIPDRYANNQTLVTDRYNFDNSPFLQSLTQAGFYVASQSAANYPFTIPSLTSSLNMIYLDSVYKNMEKDSVDSTPLLSMMENSEVLKYLKSRGYSYYHFGAEWITTKNSNANYSYSYVPKSLEGITSELSELQKDPNNLIASFLFTQIDKTSLSLFTQPKNHANYMLDQLLELSKIIPRPGPKFVFVHSLMTHDPYVFDVNGKYYPRFSTNMKGAAEPLYVEQLTFANRLLANTINTILKNSKRPPIILLQSDEGPYPTAFRINPMNYNWKNASNAEFQEKIRVLNAYYLPGKKTKMLYPSISPVNSFRVILNLYFGEDLPLLPDKHYAQVYLKYLYDIFEVTDKIKF
jgi:hypothetical protein